MSEMLQGCSISLVSLSSPAFSSQPFGPPPNPATGFTDLAEAGAEAHLVDAIERERKQQPYPALQRMIDALEGTLDVILVAGNRVLDSPIGADPWLRHTGQGECDG
jgi:hypothetical protein